MNEGIFVASINFKNSMMAERERLAFSEDEIRKIVHRVKEVPTVTGCVVLATCNRTEIYLSREIAEKEDELTTETKAWKYAGASRVMPKNAGELLLEAAGVLGFNGSFEYKEGRDAVVYLCELASGLKSQILGESQIVTQITRAWEIAKDENCTDAALNVLFRSAVAVGKTVLTKVKISGVPLSSAYAAFHLIMNYYGDIRDKKALIIGNGNMGRLMQQLLHEKGCDVIVTIRGYAHGNNTVVDGCRKIAYASRYEYMEICDFVVSATRSPHRTVKAECVEKLAKIPELMIDLAMPRDIDEKVGELCVVKNINELGFKTDVDEQTLAQVHAIVEAAVADFYHWYGYKSSMEELELLKHSMKTRICRTLQKKETEMSQEDEIIAFTVDKCLSMMIGGIPELTDRDKVKECRKRIEKRIRR